ncbi:hypothetical protein INT45_012151 [Circinella minor]|uniref:ubiquitinyl hydrolase 1 n=1 Tax=Circinella minor TaxID=1195481 RepID=A0A8H7SAA4_9FUNG|nr:hypothetical protein INT45_012151 [Circinella minor]
MPAFDAPSINELQQQQTQIQEHKIQLAYSPGALVTYVADNVQFDDHRQRCTHSLVTFLEPPLPQQKQQEQEQEQQTDEKENEPPLKATTTEQQQERFLCLNCHGVLIVQTNTEDSSVRDSCSGVGYPTHHFHNVNNNKFECCGCQFTAEFSITSPPIPLASLHSLTDDRPLYRTSVAVARKESFPTVMDGLIVLITYVRGLLKGERRNINAQNTALQARLGLDQASKSILTAIGYTFDEETNHFISPIEGSPLLDRQRLLLCFGQLLTMCYELRQEIPATAGNDSFTNAINSVWSINIGSVLGINNFLEPRNNTFTPPKLIDAYHALGTEPGASDELVVWLYRKIIEEQPKYTGIAMDALIYLAESQKASETLLTEVAIERSQGRLGDQEVKDAYTYFGVQKSDNVEDSLLVGLYEIKLTDEPNEEHTHRNKLGIIAESRNSKTLNDYLHDPKTVKSPLSDIPVGLNNIGNTCYLNSLLQYYFTLTSFRRTVLNIDDYVENEEEPDWTPKKIGGIEVDQKEVRRAKKFVFLLKDLFQHLESASQPAISPEYDLAYMALLNGRSLENDKSTSSMSTTTKNKAESSTSAATQQAEPKEGEVSSATATEQDTKMTERSEESLLEAQQKPLPPMVPEKEEVDIQMEERQEEKQELEQQKSTTTITTTETIDEFEGDEKRAKTENIKEEELATSLVPTENDTNDRMECIPKVPDNDDLNEAVKADIKKELPQPPPSPPQVTDELPPPYEDVVMEDEKKPTSVSDEKKPLQEKSLPNAPPALPPRDPRPSATNMMFGKQQDVTECMGNVMYLVEAAVKPLEKKENGEQIRDIVRDLFYGKARQILTYEDTETSKQVRKIQEEYFSHVIVDAAEGKDLYDGLDEYFFADRVEDFRAGRGAMREVTVSSFPPIFQIQVQRVQFDRTTANVYKSNAFVQFDKMIYLDRYCENNFEKLASRRIQVSSWRKELESNRDIINKLTDTKVYPMPVPELLRAAASILEENQDQDVTEQELVKYKEALNFLRENEKETREKIQTSQDHIEELKRKISSQYDDLKQMGYRLHAVFIHQGQANYGHYWIYIYNHQQEQWWKYNDSRVTRVEESEIFQNTTGSTANPYFLVYIKDSDADNLVQTIDPNNKGINEDDNTNVNTIDDSLNEEEQQQFIVDE